MPTALPIRFFRVANLDKFQHYRDRAPPWIKLHASVLRKYEFTRLQDASKAHLMQIWLLASRMNNRLPFDPRWIANQISATEPVDLCELQDGEFIEIIDDASEALATGLQHARLEGEGEGEGETDLSTPDGVEAENSVSDPAPSGNGKIPPCPIQKIIALYHDMLPECPRLLKRTATRDGYIRARWREHPGIHRFEEFFRRVKDSPFLIGKTNGTRDRRPFVADLEWLMRPNNFAKVAEGRYYDE